MACLKRMAHVYSNERHLTRVRLTDPLEESAQAFKQLHANANGIAGSVPHGNEFVVIDSHNVRHIAQQRHCLDLGQYAMHSLINHRIDRSTFRHVSAKDLDYLDGTHHHRTRRIMCRAPHRPVGARAQSLDATPLWPNLLDTYHAHPLCIPPILCTQNSMLLRAVTSALRSVVCETVIRMGLGPSVHSVTSRKRLMSKETGRRPHAQTSYDEMYTHKIGGRLAIGRNTHHGRILLEIEQASCHAAKRSCRIGTNLVTQRGQKSHAFTIERRLCMHPISVKGIIQTI